MTKQTYVRKLKALNQRLNAYAEKKIQEVCKDRDILRHNAEVLAKAQCRDRQLLEAVRKRLNLAETALRFMDTGEHDFSTNANRALEAWKRFVEKSHAL